MFIKGNIDDLNTILQRVNKFEEKGKLDQATKELEKAIKLNPNDGNYYNRLGDLYVRDNRVEKSIDAYKKGIDAYRNDQFLRNAIALCKKILRYDPDSITTYRTIAELLVELDEKSDASQYYFEYIEKQRAQSNEDEVIKTLECVRGLGLPDAQVTKRIHQIYEALGRTDPVAQLRTDVKEQTVREDKKTPEISTKNPETKVTERDDKIRSTQKINSDRRVKQFDTTITHLDTAVHDIEAAITRLSKEMRLDEVIAALDTSLATFSSEQKKAIGFLQKSLHLNLDTLQNAVKSLREGSDKNTKELAHLLKNLDKALAGLSKDQAAFSQKMNVNLEKVTATMNATAKESLEEIKSILDTYKKSTDEMCRMFAEAKDCNMSILEITEGMNLTEQKMNESLTAFITLERLRAKKQRVYSVVLISIVAVICVLLFVSVVR